MNILMTGATGFLGSHLIPDLLNSGHNLFILKRSFSDTSKINNYYDQLKIFDFDQIDIHELFEKNKIEIIIHLATDYGKKNNNNVRLMLEPNIIMPAQLLELAVRYKIEIFINADTSTDSTYTLYSAMNKAFLEIGKFFAANYEIKFINMVLQAMYGEGDDTNKFIPFAIDGILNGRAIEATKGEQKRDFIYVKDVVHAYLAVLDKYDNLKDNYYEFHIGTGEGITLRKIIDIIQFMAGEKAHVIWGAIPYKKNEMFDLKANIEKTKDILGWGPRYTIEEGLKKTLSSFFGTHCG